MRVEPEEIPVPASMSREPSFEEPQPARTSAQSKAGRTRMGTAFPWVARWARVHGLIAGGRGPRNGARLAPRRQVWLILQGVRGHPIADPKDCRSCPAVVHH